MAADEQLSVRVEVEGFEDFYRAFDKMEKEVDDLAKTQDANAQSSKKMGLSLTDLKSGVDLAVGALKTMGQVAKQAFEFLQEGAAINATKESFDRLGMSIEAMRAASNGTIDDMGLMRSALTLMAGSSGEVADAFSDAMPQLLSMAKAANKLNPTLGDTDFMLQSIATAAKRQSMQIADNLGIIVKQGDAYEKYAKSIGVSVDALTNEQKQIAFLNGLLEAGNTLIDQAGGSTESAADSYAQLTAQIGNMTDSLKAQAAEVAGPTISGFAQLIVETNKVRDEYGYITGTMAGFLDALGFSNTLIDQNRESTQAQADATERARLYGEAWAAQLAVTRVETEAEKTALNDSVIAFDQYTTATQSSQTALDNYYASQQAANEAATAAQVAFNNAASGLDELTRAAFAKEQIDALKRALDEGKISSEDYATAQEAILTQFGLLTEAEKRAQGTINTITQAFMDGKIEPEEYARLLDDVKRALDGIDGTTIDIGWNVQAPPSFLPGGQPNVGAGGINTPYQHGGTTAGGRMLVGERGPEMLTGVPGGARVLSSPTTARMMAQNNVTNNYNLTTNSLTRPGGLALEFAAMEMGSR